MNTPRRKIVDPRRHYKLAAIPVLVIVLAWQLYGALSHSGAPSASAPPLPAKIGSTPSPLSAPTAKPVRSDWSKWPRIDLKEIIACNPFVPWTSSASDDASFMAETTPTSAATAGETASESAAMKADKSGLKFNGKVQALYDDRAGTAAIVDARIIRPGDLIDGGLEVKKVTNVGIIIEPR